MAVNSWKTYPL